MDPYVKVTSMDPETLHVNWRTKIDKNGGKNPKWQDEVRTIDVYDLHDKLHFQLFDEDNMTKDDFIGEMRHSIKQLMNHEGEHGFELVREKGKGAGKLFLHISAERLVKPREAIVDCEAKILIVNEKKVKVA